MRNKAYSPMNDAPSTKSDAKRTSGSKGPQRFKCSMSTAGAYGHVREVVAEYVVGPVPGVGVMAKRSQGWVKCEDRLPYYRDSSCSLPLPRLHDHNSTTREDLAAGAGRGGARGKGPARVGLLGLQCSARALFRTAPFKKNVTRIAPLD
jgi:hypothetical protein